MADLPLHKQLVRSGHISQVQFLCELAQWRGRAGLRAVPDILHTALGRAAKHVILPPTIEFILRFVRNSAIFAEGAVAEVSRAEVWALPAIHNHP